jgi:hypothetical protein
VYDEVWYNSNSALYNKFAWESSDTYEHFTQHLTRDEKDLLQNIATFMKNPDSHLSELDEVFEQNEVLMPKT